MRVYKIKVKRFIQNSHISPICFYSCNIVVNQQKARTPVSQEIIFLVNSILVWVCLQL